MHPGRNQDGENTVSARPHKNGRIWTALHGLTRFVDSFRPAKLPYMLLFSLAPIFPNMKNSLVANADRILGLDGVYSMGIAYSLGIGLIFLLVRPALLHLVARWLSIVTTGLFLGWILTPLSPMTPWLGMFFGLGLGCCSGIALFGFTYGLNDTERLYGVAITVLFSMISQIVLSLPPLQPFSGPLYLGAQVLVTLLCFLRYQPEDYLGKLSQPKERNRKALGVVLFFFFAHRAVMFFFSYLPHVASTPWIGIAGIAVFLISLYMFFAFRFNTWYLCILFFVGMLISSMLRLVFPQVGGVLASDIIHGFGLMGYMASYYLLGYALSRFADYRRFRLTILVIFNSSLLLHMIPGAMHQLFPDAMLLTGIVMTLGLFIVFTLLSPVFSQQMFPQQGDEEKASRLQLMQERGLTDREQQITQMLLSGKLLKECAATLGVSEHTVKFHARNIYRKLGINGRNELLSAFKDLIT